MTWDFNENKPIFYIAVISILMALAGGYLGVFEAFLPILISAAFAVVTAVFPIKMVIGYCLLLAISTYISYGNLISAAFFLLTVFAIALPIGLGIRKKLDFKSFMLYSIGSLCVVMAGALTYNAYQAGVLLNLENVIEHYLKPTTNLIDSLRQNANAADVDFNEIIAMMRNMSIGLIINFVILEIFIAYLLTVWISKSTPAIKSNLMYPIYNFNMSKVGGILFIAAAVMGFFNAEGPLYLISLNFVLILQLPMALCGLCHVNKFMNLYNMKHKTRKTIMAVLVFLCVAPLFNMLSSMAFFGALSCLYDFTNIKPLNK